MNGVRMRASGVSVTRGTRVVLDDVTIELKRGEVLALVGPNGAGKSTLMQVLAGDVRPSAGTVAIDERELSSVRPHERARLRAVLTQSNDVSFPFTVAEVVRMGRSPWRDRSSVELDDALVSTALVEAEVAGFADRRLPELSGGERARVAYARVRAQGCEIMLLDEPTASLDIHHQERLLAQLRVHADEGGSALVVLHDLNLAAAYADRVAVLMGGRLRACAEPAESLTSELLTEVYGHPIVVELLAETGHRQVRPVRPARTSRNGLRKESTIHV